MIIVGRWINRPPHRNFLRTVNDPYWYSPDRNADLVIAYHGVSSGNSLDEDLMGVPTVIYHKDVSMLDFRADTDGTSQGQFAYELHRFAYECRNTYPVYALLDDDAWFKTPKPTIQSAIDAIRVEGHAATGPHDAYRRFIKYNDFMVDYPFYKKMEWSPWTTTGVQFYSSQRMSEIKEHWSRLLPTLKSNCDYPLWTILDNYGYMTSEYEDKNFIHQCSNGKSKEYTEQWYHKRILDAVSNYDNIYREFERLPDPDKAIARAEVILKNRINRSIKDGKQYMTSEWTAPLLDHYKNLDEYIDTYLNYNEPIKL